MTQEKILNRIEGFRYGANEIVAQHYKRTFGWTTELTVKAGKRYARIILRQWDGYRLVNNSVWLIIDLINGNIHPAKTATRPKTEVLANVNMQECGLEKLVYDGTTLTFLT